MGLSLRFYIALIVIQLCNSSFLLSQKSPDTLRVNVTSPLLKHVQRKVVVSLGEPDSGFYVQPFPKIGWDSLAKSIRYPELARRAGLEGCYSMDVLIDTNGVVKSLEFADVPDVFRDPIERAFRSTKWSPALWAGERTDSKMKLPVVFFLRGYRKGNALVIEAEAYKRTPRIDY